MRYETHSHTSETSRCSHISGAELAEFYKSLGYTGLFITDHFFNGNTTVPATSIGMSGSTFSAPVTTPRRLPATVSVWTCFSAGNIR